MRKIILFYVLLLATLTHAQVAQYDTNGNNKVNVTDVTKVVDQLNKGNNADVNRDGKTDIKDAVSVAHYLLYNEGGFDFVDLGLPSKTLWATCNVGATKPEEYGNYYAWGETTAKSDYTWKTYQLCNGSSSSFTKYNTESSHGVVDNKTQLETMDDAAQQVWKHDWRLPTQNECAELRNTNYCTWTKTTINNVVGYLVTSKTNGNSIFLPFAGYKEGTNHTGLTCGYYWTSSLNASSPWTAYNMVIDNSNFTLCNNRYYGRSVRPVLQK